MSYTTVVSPEVVLEHLDDPSWLVLDCRHSLADFTAGRASYEAGHIPGACFADVENDLAGRKTGTNGRHPLPEPEEFAEFLRHLGAGDETQIVAYDEGGDMYAARCWLLCRWIGHDEAAILDGGMSAWRAAGYPIEKGHTEPGERRRAAGGELRVRLHPELIVDAQAVLKSLETASMEIVDARGGERFRGEIEPIDRVPGHIPGARNRAFKENFDEHARLKSPQRLREEFGAYGDPSRVVHQCGSGVSSAVNALAMEHAGLRGWRVYVGSWSEWSSDPARPVETGTQRG
ncbi:MAG: sulfurtransferase [Candidatus Tyrphobacter sp.]